MEEKYFDKWEFLKADRDININPQKSKINFEEYLKKYPKDYGTYPYYASCCITLGKFNEAYKILNYLEKEYKNDTKFLKLKDRVKHVEYGILYNKLRLLSFTHKYKEMYDLCLKNYDKIIISCGSKRTEKLIESFNQPMKPFKRALCALKIKDFKYNFVSVSFSI